MNSNNLVDLVHQGFRITLGAATSAVETIQDPQKREELVETLQNPRKREETLSNWQTQLNQRTEEWAQKGEVTEKAAQQVVSDLLQQGESAGNSSTTSSSAGSTTTTDTYVQLELQELTEEIISLRTALEQLREPEE